MIYIKKNYFQSKINNFAKLLKRSKGLVSRNKINAISSIFLEIMKLAKICVVFVVCYKEFDTFLKSIDLFPYSFRYFV